MNRKVKNIILICLCLVFVIIIIYVVKKIIYNVKYNKTIGEIMSDNVEIEKKWLIDANKIPYNFSNAEITKIEQTYINFSPEIRVRRLDDGKAYTFAVKTNLTSDGMQRNEIEESITEEEYKNLIKKREGKTINKTRYQFLEGENLLAIDIFEGDLQGLAYLEIEFANKEEANNFQTPNWVIKDVTDDVRYKNGHLARYGIPKE